MGSINWSQVAAAGYRFAIIRVADGATVIDPQFATNWAGAASNGLVRGAYQFFEPSQDPTAQANLVVQKVGMLKTGDLPVAADVEITGGVSTSVLVANLQTWSSVIQQGTGRAPLIGTSRGFWDGTLGGPTPLGADSLWVFNFATTCPDLPSEWSTWAFWMSSGTATVPGISVQADIDEFNGSSAALSALASPSAAPAMENGWTVLLMLLLVGASASALVTRGTIRA
jgi:lysozyme